VNIGRMKDKKIIKNTENNIHIKKSNWNSIGFFFLGVFLLFLSCISIKLAIIKWKDLGLDILFKCRVDCNQFANIIQLDICFKLIITSILILFGIIFTFNLLDKSDWKKLIYGLFYGLIVGLVYGLIVGLIYGVTDGLIAGFFAGLILGLIVINFWIILWIIFWIILCADLGID